MVEIDPPNHSLYNRKVKRTILWLLAGIMLTQFLPALDKPYVYTLQNGMTVILSPLPGMQAACVLVYHKNGVRHDPPSIRGASYLYQYLMMLATENLDDFDRFMLIRKNGGESNARVSMDYAYFSQLVPDHTLANSFWLERERLTTLLFFNQTINSQKRNLVRHITRLLNENIQYRAVRWIFSKALSGTIYEAPVYGTLETLKNLDNTSIRSRYPAFQSPENIILVVTGNIRIRETIAQIKDNFSQLNSLRPPVTSKFVPSHTRIKGVRDTWRSEKADSFSTYYGFRSPGRVSVDYLPFQALITFLSDPRSSRMDKILNQDNHLNIQLFRELTNFYEANACVFKISSTSRLVIEKAAYLIERQLEALWKGRLTNNDLRTVKTMMEIDFRKAMLDPERRALWLAEQLRLKGYRKDWDADFINELKKLSILEISRVSRKYLDPANRITLNVYKK